VTTRRIVEANYSWWADEVATFRAQLHHAEKQVERFTSMLVSMENDTNEESAR
jgi:hypothetical protein